MVGDITYIPTWEGWLYLATVIDCHTKEVIGWAADDNYKTPLIERAIEMAARNRPLAGKAIFHSDRGSNYTSAQFAKTLQKHDLRHSAGRTGICYDNAMAQCRSIKRRDGAAVSSAVNCAQYSYLRVASRNKSWAGLSLLYAGRTAPGGLG
jgi:transposase InsO family protein